MKTLTLIYLRAQVIASVIVILFGVSYSVRCLIDTIINGKGAPGYIISVLFSLIAVVGWRLMYRSSIKELRAERMKI